MAKTPKPLVLLDYSAGIGLLPHKALSIDVHLHVVWCKSVGRSGFLAFSRCLLHSARLFRQLVFEDFDGFGVILRCFGFICNCHERKENHKMDGYLRLP